MATTAPSAGAAAPPDAPTALLLSLQEKLVRIETGSAAAAKDIEARTKDIALLQGSLQAAAAREQRIAENEAALLEPDWRGLCSVTAPEPSTMLKLVVQDGSQTILTVGLTDPQQKRFLGGKTVSVPSVPVARCLSAYLRGSGFIPPPNSSSSEDLAAVLHLSSDLRLDGLAQAVKEFILMAAGAGDGNNNTFG